nr:MAG TPA: hypothetical protein [Caudoviricetes sp.]
MPVSFLFLIFVPINISILKVKADMIGKYHYSDR